MARRMPVTAGPRSSEIFHLFYLSRSKHYHDTGRTSGTFADVGSRRWRGGAGGQGGGHAAFGARRPRSPLSDVTWDDSRSRHAQAPGIREILRLRAGSIP